MLCIEDLSNYSNEKEVLLPLTTTFEVHGSSNTGGYLMVNNCTPLLEDYNSNPVLAQIELVQVLRSDFTETNVIGNKKYKRIKKTKKKRSSKKAKKKRSSNKGN